MTAPLLSVRGARQHNLKNVDVDLPRDAIVVLTGPSGSGKSSLAFDTIYAEGQRRYVESLHGYARQFLEQLDKPDVESITGLSPAIAVRQEPLRPSPRSTVGTITEVHDRLRVLFARVGVAHCPKCDRAIRAHTAEQMIQRAMARGEGARLSITAPIARGVKGDLKEEIGALRKDGFVRALLDGAPVDLGEDPKVDPKKTHDLDVVIDRVAVRDESRSRLADAIELALKKSGGLVRLVPVEGESELLSERPMCTIDGIVLPAITPRTFSFVTPEGACPRCEGIGTIAPEKKPAPKRAKPSKEEEDEVESAPRDEEREVCPECAGSRLNETARQVTVAGVTLPELDALATSSLRGRLAALPFAGVEREIAAPLLDEIEMRLAFLDEVGVGYLSLGRSSQTLSSGEAQRLRLATRLGGPLVGVLYVLDEPSLGLHPRDTARLVRSLERLRDQGNTVLVVEHDLDVVRAADHVVDMGPGAGVLGGRIVAQGKAADLAESPASVTGPYLRETRKVVRKVRLGKGALVLEGAHTHNLKSVAARFPIGALTAVTGVSGAGKSSLVMGTLLPLVRAEVHRGTSRVDAKLEGGGAIARVVAVDEVAIGRTSRSTPASYVGLLAPLRDLFASLPEARARGYGATRFSSNVKGGRCETCKGEGVLSIEMQLLPDLAIQCPECGGRRYNRETLEVKWKGMSIADVLALSVDEARPIFAVQRHVAARLETMHELGLGYLRLGQSATTLSGGEAQRLALARELSRRSTETTLYVLDEPTTGLHATDVELLVAVLDRLADEGHAVVVIEHDPLVIARADHVVDLGPEGGEGGGRVLAAGTPKEIVKAKTATGVAIAGLVG
ncbi:MAG: excinuclease ABC subunit UvrA [Sandaracinus sp.]